MLWRGKQRDWYIHYIALFVSCYWHKTPAEIRKAFFQSAGVFRKRIMKKENELVLKVTKEIIVKFIEMGQLSVNSFEKVFKEVHVIVSDALKRTSETGKHED